ncbi:uncharacterized protein LOC126994653 isoform X2 [Eriocheir sinensis]|uniref:uncharacterized protein LOC126994653 isoform X2 n=1 Tax=Eriocheir sinensis TaxID=95602 RepID=UPI0021C75950|nr:uncharacterized protein LOC126994653 isoform X2 [Eriocheir sinensis]
MGYAPRVRVKDLARVVQVRSTFSHTSLPPPLHSPADPKSMSPLREDSPVSSPRTRSPAKGVRTGGVSCAGPDALSMLNMLAEVASVTLHTDPSVTDTAQTCRVKASSTTSRRPSDYDLLTLDQVSGMTDYLLLKLFAECESNEMWKRFTYTCGMLPAACSKFFQSFGSEHKARSGMKTHLQAHLKSLLEVHKSIQSRQSYLLESIPARKRRLSQQDTSGGKKRGNTGHARANKSSGSPKTQLRAEVCSKSKKVVLSSKEKENEVVKKKDDAQATSDRKSNIFPQASVNVEEINEELFVGETKPKRKLENGREVKVRAKKVKAATSPPVPAGDSNDSNNNSSDVKPVVGTAIIPLEVKREIERPPIQQVVSHDHGYLRVSPLKWDTGEQRDTKTWEQPAREGSHKHHPQASYQVAWNRGGVGGGRVDGSVSCLQVKEENLPEDQSTLLHQHMNEELQGGIMAQGCGSAGTPLPVVGCEVEFTPDQHYKVMRSADLPVVYDHNNPSGEMEGVEKVIERDEYKVRKKPKGRAKFIGQSKAEKEMALKLINEIRSQSVMALETLECKICHPPRLFTAPSTLLSHYRSHAGIRPYECRICEAVFTRQHSLNYHMLIHTNQTRFTCSDCGRKFRHPSHFKEHRRRHTGESPYECSDCLMRFKTRNTYKRHLRTRHGKLLTTQGTIIILSQEEADRMKKSQGRKPRRPRQPLKIISPEAAAQMEEEQVWTDFEEGDREEEEEEEEDEEEEEEEEEGVSYGEVLQSRKLQGVAGSYQVPLNSMEIPVEMQQITNGKTGLFVKSKRVLPDTSNVEQVKEWEGHLQGNGLQVDKHASSQEIVEEEVVMEGVGDLRTYVFQPPPEHNTLPKVNIRSSWNTINIDLKSLEMASELTIPEDQVDGEILEGPQNQIKGEVTNLDTGCKELVGDHISPEEVITICSGMDNVNEEAGAPGTLQQHSDSGSNLDWFTVKKPVRCYGRPGSGTGDHHEALSTPSCGHPELRTCTNNGHEVDASGTIQQQPDPGNNFDWFAVKKPIKSYGKPGTDAMSTASCVQPDVKTSTSNSQGLYVVEYVHSHDGRLAKVYRASASLIPKSSQHASVHPPQVISVLSRGSVPEITNSGSNKLTVPITVPVSTMETTTKAVSPAPEGPRVLTKVVSHQDPPTRISTHSSRLTVSCDKPMIHKQVVNNLGRDHAIKSESLISCREPQNPTVTLHSSPSVVVTTVPHVCEAQQLPGSQSELFPWSSQSLPDNTQVTTYSVNPCVGETGAPKNTVTHLDERNNITYPLISQDVQQYVGVQDDLLLENVEIIESFNVGDEPIMVTTGLAEEAVQSGCVAENISHLREVPESGSTLVKVEGLVPCESSILNGTTDYMDHLLHHNMVVASEQTTTIPQGSSPPSITVAAGHSVTSTLQV